MNLLIEFFLAGSLQKSESNVFNIFGAPVVVYEANDNKLSLKPNEKVDKLVGYRHAFQHEYKYEKDGAKILPNYTITSSCSEDMINHLLQTKKECFEEETMKFLSIDSKISERMEKVFLRCFDIKHDNLYAMFEEQLKEYQRNNEKLEEKVSKISENIDAILEISENVDAILVGMTQKSQNKHTFANIVHEVIQKKIRPKIEMDPEQDRKVIDALNMAKQPLRESSNSLELVDKNLESEGSQASLHESSNSLELVSKNSESEGSQANSGPIAGKKDSISTFLPSFKSRETKNGGSTTIDQIDATDPNGSQNSLSRTVEIATIGNQSRPLSINSNSSDLSTSPPSRSRSKSQSVQILNGQTVQYIIGPLSSSTTKKVQNKASIQDDANAHTMKFKRFLGKCICHPISFCLYLCVVISLVSLVFYILFPKITNNDLYTMFEKHMKEYERYPKKILEAQQNEAGRNQNQKLVDMLESMAKEYRKNIEKAEEKLSKKRLIVCPYVHEGNSNKFINNTLLNNRTSYFRGMSKYWTKSD